MENETTNMNLTAGELGLPTLLMGAIRFFCHSAWGYKEITCDSGTSVEFAAKGAAAAFFLDDDGKSISGKTSGSERANKDSCR